MPTVMRHASFDRCISLSGGKRLSHFAHATAVIVAIPVVANNAFSTGRAAGANVMNEIDTNAMPKIALMHHVKEVRFILLSRSSQQFFYATISRITRP